MSKVPACERTTRKPTSISADPSTVNTRNRVAARRRPGSSWRSPQPLMTNHIGIRATSKKAKNSTRSSARKLPSTPASMSSSRAASSARAPQPGSWRTSENRQSATTSVLISTSGPLIPSSPRCQSTPSSAIHGWSTWLPSSAAEASIQAHSDQPKVTTPPTTASATAAVSRRRRSWVSTANANGTATSPLSSQALTRGPPPRRRSRRHPRRRPSGSPGRCRSGSGAAARRDRARRRPPRRRTRR